MSAIETGYPMGKNIEVFVPVYSDVSVLGVEVPENGPVDLASLAGLTSNEVRVHQYW